MLEEALALQYIGDPLLGEGASEAKPMPEDAWREFYVLDEGYLVECAYLRRFALFLLAKSTKHIILGQLGMSRDTAHLALIGPRADDGFNMFCYFVVTRAEMSRLNIEERIAFKKRLVDMTVELPNAQPDATLTTNVLTSIGLLGGAFGPDKSLDK